MRKIVLDRAPFQIDAENILEALRIPPDADAAEPIRRLAEQASTVAKPKAIYKIAFVDSRDTDSVVIENIRFTSRILRINLDPVERVFPFVATCGAELEEWSQSIDGTLERYVADVIKELAVESAAKAVGEDLVRRFRPGATASMHPGELEDWPISEQKNLFALVGNVTGAIGVQLTDSFMMYPAKSVSGICFPSESGFESCRLCPHEKCPKRRAPYDPTLYEREYKS